ncbi:MAG TPA: L,D-transpeptidase family protein [Candidatus Ozemobacteraceae bacterium]|nr:L,D-transpeptidase family protein [Candidatus Ozemobacteraceae bacterium]
MGHTMMRGTLCVALLLAGVCTPLFAQQVSPFGSRPVETETDRPAAVSGTTSTPATGVSAASAQDVAWVRQDMAEKQGNTVLIIKDNVNIRSGPSTSNKILQMAPLGATFALLGTQNGWYRISLKAVAVEPTATATPEEIEAAQNEFLDAYKIYTKAALAGGRNGTAAKKALSAFQAKYAAYKTLVKTSTALRSIKSGRSTVDKVVISKTDFTSTVYSNGRVVRVFPIAYGANPDGMNKQKQGDSRTPEGTFKIMNKAKNPIYKGIAGGAPNNPLGTRWMGLNTWSGSIGMHGTSAPGSIGSRASHGCVRMYTADAEELFDLVRVGTPVIIEPVKQD